MVVKRLGVLSLGKVMGVLYALFGLLFGVFFAFFSLLGAAVGAANSGSSTDVLIGLFFGVGSIIFLPLFYGILGFIFGLLTALIYNAVARLIGGIELEVEQQDRGTSSVSDFSPQRP
jgi:hypothetical protein